MQSGHKDTDMKLDDAPGTAQPDLTAVKVLGLDRINLAMEGAG
jgi:hypothetical protein